MEAANARRVVLNLLPSPAASFEDVLKAYSPRGKCFKVARGLQKSLCRSRATSALERLARSCSLAFRALLVTNKAKWASTWMTAIPRSDFTQLADLHYRIAFRLRLGLPPRICP